MTINAKIYIKILMKWNKVINKHRNKKSHEKQSNVHQQWMKMWYIHTMGEGNNATCSNTGATSDYHNK